MCGFSHQTQYCKFYYSPECGKNNMNVPAEITGDSGEIFPSLKRIFPEPLGKN